MPQSNPAATLERAKSLCNECVFTVALQCRRLATTEPEDKVFVLRFWADLQFLIVALSRLKRVAKLAASVEPSGDIKSALEEFDKALPALSKMRNIGEHIDEYAKDAGFNKSVSREQLQVGSWDGKNYRWLGDTLNIDDALATSEKLFEAVRLAAQEAQSAQPPEETPYPLHAGVATDRPSA